MWYADRKIKHLLRLAVDKKIYLAEMLALALELPTKNIIISNNCLIDKYTNLKNREKNWVQTEDMLIPFEKDKLLGKLKPSQVTTILNYFYNAGFRYNVTGDDERNIKKYKRHILIRTKGDINHIKGVKPNVRKIMYSKAMVEMIYDTKNETVRCNFISEQDNIKSLLLFEDTFKDMSDLTNPYVYKRVYTDASITSITHIENMGIKGMYSVDKNSNQELHLNVDITFNKVSYIEELRAIELALDVISKQKNKKQWNIIYTEAFYVIPYLEGRRNKLTSIERRFIHLLEKLKQKTRRNKVIIMYVKAHHKTEYDNIENKIIDINCKNFMRFKTVVLPKDNTGCKVSVNISGNKYKFISDKILRDYNNNLQTLSVKRVDKK